MKTIFKLHILAALLFVSSAFAYAQNTAIALEKRKIIAEIVSETKADQQMRQVMQAMFKQMNDNYPAIIKGILNQRPEVTAEQKAKLELELIGKQKDFDQRFQQKMIQAINFQEFIEATVYPLYDKNFTEAELNDLLNFYKTSTGKKLNEVLPQLTADSVRLSTEYLIPKIDRIFDEVIKEQMTAEDAARNSALPKPNNN